jgi:hypothetical protein
MSEELKEWLGVKPADFLVYAAIGSVLIMYFGQSTRVDVLMSFLAVGACGGSCYWGMKSDPRVSPFTNVVKKVSYPFCLVAALVCIYLNFQVWNP